MGVARRPTCVLCVSSVPTRRSGATRSTRTGGGWLGPSRSSTSATPCSHGFASRLRAGLPHPDFTRLTEACLGLALARAIDDLEPGRWEDDDSIGYLRTGGGKEIDFAALAVPSSLGDGAHRADRVEVGVLRMAGRGEGDRGEVLCRRGGYADDPRFVEPCVGLAGAGARPAARVGAGRPGCSVAKRDLRHLRGHRRDPAARDRSRDQRHAHQVTSAATKPEPHHSAGRRRWWRPARRTGSRTRRCRRPDRVGLRTHARARRRCREARGQASARAPACGRGVGPARGPAPVRVPLGEGVEEARSHNSLPIRTRPTDECFAPRA